MEHRAERMRVRPWAAGVAIVAAIALSAAGCGKSGEHASASTGVPVVAVNSPAPNFTMPDYGTAGNVSLSDLRGKVVLVNFWASWCKYCKAEMPEISSLYRQYHDQGFVVLGVIVNSQPAEVDQVLQRFQLPYRSVTGTEGLAQIWHVQGLPTSYLIDRNGIIRKFYEGARPRSTFEYDIVRLLNQKPGQSS